MKQTGEGTARATDLGGPRRRRIDRLAGDLKVAPTKRMDGRRKSCPHKARRIKVRLEALVDNRVVCAQCNLEERDCKCDRYCMYCKGRTTFACALTGFITVPTAARLARLPW